jgi:hypothetical protein
MGHVQGTRGCPRSHQWPPHRHSGSTGHGSRLHHLGIGRTHAHTPVLILVTADTVTVISKTSYQLIAGHHIDPDHNYWPNQNKTPADGRGNL